jgi:hypothetical protein
MLLLLLLQQQQLPAVCKACMDDCKALVRHCLRSNIEAAVPLLLSMQTQQRQHRLLRCAGTADRWGPHPAWYCTVNNCQITDIKSITATLADSRRKLGRKGDSSGLLLGCYELLSDAVVGAHDVGVVEV